MSSIRFNIEIEGKGGNENEKLQTFRTGGFQIPAPSAGSHHHHRHHRHPSHHSSCVTVSIITKIIIPVMRIIITTLLVITVLIATTIPFIHSRQCHRRSPWNMLAEGTWHHGAPAVCGVLLGPAHGAAHARSPRDMGPGGGAEVGLARRLHSQAYWRHRG